MRRCLPLVAITLLAGVLVSPLVGAQGGLPAGYRVAATPANAEVFPGDEARFTISVSNDALVGESTALLSVLRLPFNWSWDFTPANLTLPAGSFANSTLSIYVPASSPPVNATIEYEARSNESIPTIARGIVNLTVKPRPAASFEPPPPSEKPALTLGVTTGDSAASGSNATGAITLRHDDATRDRLTVRLVVASAPAGWNPVLKETDQNRVLQYLQSTLIPLKVLVPELAQNTTATITLTATVLETGTVFTARWIVLGVAAPAPAPGPEAPPASEPAAATPPATPTRPRATGPNLEVLVEPLELAIESGGEATATVKLYNSGSTSLELRVMATQPVSWRTPELDPREFSLAPGERRDVALTLHAPEGIPTGGSATVPVTVVGPASLTRRAEFLIEVVEPSIPRDRTTTNTPVPVPVAPEGSTLPAFAPTVLLAVGLAAVGSGALVLASRPLREKLLWGAAGLYTRLARPDVMGHEDREKLYRLVETQPGIHFHALQRDLAWNTGTLTYHLRVLERHGFVVSRRDGLYRRFYLSGAAPRKEVFENAGPSGLRADVLDAVRNTPGISQSDLALGLGANKQTVNYHVKALERAGTIRVEKRGRDTFLYASDASAPGPETARA